MSRRFDTQGLLPIVEYRSRVDRYFVVFDEAGVELAPAFLNKWTAAEIATHCYHGTPFFTMIPVVPKGTIFPRPNIVMPKIRELDIKLRLT